MSTDSLRHFGVKGMRWGVRKAEPSGGPQKLNRAEKKHFKKAASSRGLVSVHNAAAKRMNDVEIPRLNNKPAYKNKDFTQDSPLRRKYYKDYESTLDRVMVDEYNKQFGTAPTGRKLKFGMKNGQLGFEWDDARHAMEDDDPPFSVRVNDRGYITAILFLENALRQSEDVDDFLEHFGVKGMKWGVRRTDPSAGSQDHKKAYKIKSKARSGGGTRALTNKELRAYIERANLERQYAQLTPTTGSKARKFIAETLLGVGKQQAGRVANDIAAQQIAKALKK